MAIMEGFKHYFWGLFSIIGVVFFWAGVWDGVGNLGPLVNPLVSLAVGILLLSLSGVIFKETNPFWEPADPVKIALETVHKHPEKHLFHIRYHDRLKNKELLYEAKKLKKIEKGFMIFVDKDYEVFIPTSRVTEILHKGKTHWKTQHASAH